MKAIGTRDVDTAVKRVTNWSSFHVKDVMSEPASLEEVIKGFASYEQGLKIKLLISILSVDVSKLSDNYELYERLFATASDRSTNDMWVVVSAYLIYKRFVLLLIKFQKKDVSLPLNQNIIEISHFMNYQSKQIIDKITSAVLSEDLEALRYLLPYESTYITSSPSHSAASAAAKDKQVNDEHHSNMSSSSNSNSNSNSNCVWIGNKPDFLLGKRGAGDLAAATSVAVHTTSSASKSSSSISTSTSTSTSDSARNSNIIGNSNANIKKPQPAKPENTSRSNHGSSLFTSRPPPPRNAVPPTSITVLKSINSTNDGKEGKEDEPSKKKSKKENDEEGTFLPIKDIMKAATMKKGSATPLPPPPPSSSSSSSSSYATANSGSIRASSPLLPPNSSAAPQVPISASSTSIPTGSTGTAPPNKLSSLPADLNEILTSMTIDESAKLLIDYFFRIYKFRNNMPNSPTESENKLNIERINKLWPSGEDLKEFNIEKADGQIVKLTLSKALWKYSAKRFKQ